MTAMARKAYYVMHNVGKAKYLLNYHDGHSTHGDGSPFWGAACISNKRELARRIQELTRQGYVERGFGQTNNLDDDGKRIPGQVA